MPTSQTSVKRVDRVLFKSFKPVAIPGFRVTQTKYITYKGELYCIIGHKNFRSPLYTHFDVINSYGERASEEVGLVVYQYISMLALTQYMNDLNKWLEPRGEISEQTRTIEAQLKQYNGEDLSGLLDEQKQILERFEAVFLKAKKVLRANEWTTKQFNDIQRSWRRFWTLYEKRLPKLFNYRTFILNHQLSSELEDQQTSYLFAEANAMHQLLVDMIPTEQPIITNVNDLIQLNYELGRKKTAVNELVKPSENFSFHFFKYGLVASFVFMIVSLVLWITGRFGFLVFVGSIALGAIFLSVRIANDVGLFRLIDKRLKELRAKQLPSTQVIKRSYKKALNTKVKNQPLAKPYEFTGTLVKAARWLLGFGISFMIVGLLFLDAQYEYLTLTVGYLIFGATLTVVGLFLPRWRISKREFTLKSGHMTIGKHTLTREDIIKVKTYDKGHKIKVTTRTHPNAITYKLDKEHGEEINAHLKTWCDAHFVECQ